MDKRVLLAITLCMVVYLVFMMLTPQPNKGKSMPQTKKEVTGQPNKIDNSKAENKEQLHQDYNLPTVELKEMTLGNDLYGATFSNRGASLKTLILKGYKDYKKEKELILLSSAEENPAHFVLRAVGNSVDLGKVNWEIRNSDGKSIEFSCLLPNGLEIRKSFTISTNTYNINLTLSIKNKLSTPVKSTFELTAFAGLQQDSPYREEAYLQGFIGTKPSDYAVEYVNPANIKDGVMTVKYKDTVWQGIKNRYFTGVVIPQDNSLIDSYSFNLVKEHQGIAVNNGGKDVIRNNVSCGFKTVEIEFQPGADNVYGFNIYTGPIHYSELEEQKSGLLLLLDYAGFDFIGFTILGILNFFFNIFRNYGVAILLTTFLIRLLLFPLTKKGQVSMYKLQRIQPKLLALKEQYKNDKQKFAQEQMRMFKEYGVNPLGGCLPMLIQLPVWFGMYSVCDISIDFRQAHFMSWMNDLSEPDRLAQLPFSILGTSDLNLLPIIMVIVSIVQMLMQPASPDPQARTQQRMMLFMWPIMGMLFYGLAAGLSLYFITNSVLAIAEQRIIKKYFIKA
ncbi:MAG: hypothetical protein A2W05_09400 [Candidatus Schekmanbacteria bacterium RBG_16_38_10]|uniref:Membrane protein insertase YidC n=1 Tax=Candidatus Schekmanbacteria bacterium RBG_16_38_10 TaxID=1817879 RepID=A0A1F7S0D7_9BACT|nr:MAG: hypothetical protein A2W05_09400 [Candidatus Schekmanbacteria bacterium RBG_16_38_10]